LEGPILFEEGDFRALSEPLCADPEHNARRLATRRKLLALGKRIAQAAGNQGTPLEVRTSLHNPHAFNANRVKRLWAYLTRPRAEKKQLKAVLGPELGKDLDAAYRNAYLCLAIEADFLEVSFRIHPEAWYDGQNLKNKVERQGPRAFLALLNRLAGHRLVLHDWKGEWRCGELSVERLEEYLEAYTPGEHRLAVERRFPAPEGARAAAFELGVAGELERELLSLLPVYLFTMWAPGNDHLFARER
jgi:hypothetical protein